MNEILNKEKITLIMKIKGKYIKAPANEKPVL